MNPIDKSKVRAVCSVCKEKHWYSFEGLCNPDTINRLLFQKGWTVNSKSGRLEFCPHCKEKKGETTP